MEERAADLKTYGQLTVRDVAFDLDAAPKFWFDPDNPEGPNEGVTAFFNALSIALPQAERVMIRSLLYYRDRIDDPALLDGIRGFKAQESIHTREHENYNRRLREFGYDVDRMEARQDKVIDWVENRLGPEINLAVTVCMEHFTAMMAEQVGDDPRFFDKAHPAYRDLWTWHSLEEAEHSAVSFDVLKAIRPGYFFRVGVMMLSGLIFLGMMRRNLTHILSVDGRIGSLKVWGQLFGYLYLSPGFARRMTLSYLRFFVPGFHPSQTRKTFSAEAKARYDAMARRAGVRLRPQASPA